MPTCNYSIRSVEFVKPNRYLCTLHAAQVYSPTSHEPTALFARSFACMQEFLAALASHAQALETQDVVLAQGEDGPSLHLLSLDAGALPEVGFLTTLYVSASEPNPTDYRLEDHPWAQDHELVLYDTPSGASLCFDHGVFGKRDEAFSSMGQGLARLVEVLRGVSWFDFGDAASRKTLLGKGQFYWESSDRQLVPVDNFVYKLSQEAELKLEASGGHHYHLSSRGLVETVPDSTRSTYSEGLRALAAALRMPASSQPSSGPFLYATKREPLEQKGRFVVRSVLQGGDEHEAPVLVFKTPEGHQAALRTVVDTRPSVVLTLPDGAAFHKEVPSLSEALYLLASVLEEGHLPEELAAA